jgi:hypothetical protein
MIQNYILQDQSRINYNIHIINPSDQQINDYLTVYQCERFEAVMVYS